MRVAEQEIFISRPFAPTRRVALGESNLPSHPSPGAGGLLLAGVVAHFSDRIHPDLLDEQLHLITQLESGQRITQPRLRHRFQTDRIGLQRCYHQLSVVDDRLQFDIDDHTGTAEQHVLCALYAAAQLPMADRRGVFGAIRVGLRWPGDVDAGFAALVTGRRNGSQLSALADPETWARHLLGGRCRWRVGAWSPRRIRITAVPPSARPAGSATCRRPGGCCWPPPVEQRS